MTRGLLTSALREAEPVATVGAVAAITGGLILHGDDQDDVAVFPHLERLDGQTIDHVGLVEPSQPSGAIEHEAVRADPSEIVGEQILDRTADG